MAATVLAVFVAQTRGVMFYDLQVSGACYGDQVALVRQPLDRFDVNYVNVVLVRGWFQSVLGHLEAHVAAFLSPLIRDVPLRVSG